MKKILKHTLLFILIAFMVVWLGSLIKCEVLTKLHYDEFKATHLQNPMIGDIDYFKVIEYDKDTTAKVYYVGENKSGGFIMELKYIKSRNIWKETYWNGVWSGTGGTADNVLWPYWWHFIYIQ